MSESETDLAGASPTERDDSNVPSESEESVDRLDRRRFWIATASVFAMFMLYSPIQSNIPGVNEPHYLTKGRHVWNPDWCAGDLFLESSNPHLVFYRTFGLLAYLFHFPVAALLGRIVAYGMLAFAWTRLATVLTGKAATAVVSASLFLLLASIDNWSGEWLVGGVESKVVAYAFAFQGLASLLERRLPAAAVWMGLSVSFHPVVGAWFVLAVGTAVLAGLAFDADGSWKSVLGAKRILLAIVGFAIAAAPGLIPAVQLLGTGTPEQSLEAARYQVNTRLAHHLNPLTFGRAAHVWILCLTAITVGCLLTLRSNRQRHDVRAVTGFGFVAIACAASLLFAAAGVAIAVAGRGEGPAVGAIWAIQLLKFYPFRLADVLVPVLLSLLVAFFVVTRTENRVSSIVALGCLAGAILIPLPTRDSSRMSAANKDSWGGICWWLRTETPVDSVVFGADTQWALKWFAQRPEYVNYKDCPQDGPAIEEFRRRRRVLYDWSVAARQDQVYSAGELRELHALTGIDYLVAQKFGPIDMEPVYVDGEFRVYKLDGPR